MGMQEFETTVSEFTLGAAAAKQKISDMLALLTDGKVPSRQEVSEFDKDINGLQLQYTLISSLTREMVAEDELPADGSSVSQYVLAVNNSASRRVMEQRNRIQGIITRFLTVSSSIAAYEDAIVPYKKEAIAMLEELAGTADGIIPQHIVEGSHAQQLFLEALEIDDFDNDDGIRILDRLAETYPHRVNHGVALKKYAFGETLYSVGSEPLDEKNNEESNESGTGETLAGDKNDAATINSPPEAEVGRSPSPSESAPAALVQSRLKLKNTKPSAKSFKSDVLRLPQAVRTILPLLTHLGTLTANQAYSFGCCMDCFGSNTTAEDIKGALDQLTAKGYVSAYDIPGREDTVYCLSPLGTGCMKKDLIAGAKNTLWTLFLGKKKVIGEREMEKDFLLADVAKNDCLLQYISGQKQNLSSNDYETIKSSIQWKEDYYIVDVIWEKQHYCCGMTDSIAVAAPMEDDILVVSDELPPVNEVNGHTYFAYANSTLFRWEGEWTASSDHPGPDTLDPEIQSVDASDEDDYPAPELSWEEQEETSSVAAVAYEPLRTSGELDSCREAATLLEASGNQEESKLAECVVASSSEGFFEQCRRLLSAPQAPRDKEFAALIDFLLSPASEGIGQGNEAVMYALILAKAAAFGKDNTACKGLYHQLLLATNLPVGGIEYTGEALLSAFPQYDEKTEGMMLSAYMFAMLFPFKAFDYTLQTQANANLENYEAAFPSYSFLKPLYHRLVGMNKYDMPDGFSNAIISLLGDAEEKAGYIKALNQKADFLLSEPVIKAKITGLPDFCRSCFGINSELRGCMEIIAHNSYGDKGFVEQVLLEYRSENGDLLAAKIDEKIDKEWEKATEGKRTRRIKLRHLARRQVIDAFQQRLSLMEDWVDFANRQNDKNLSKWRELKADLLRLIHAAIASGSLNSNVEHVLLFALGEMQRRLSGKTQSEPVFSDFLKTGFLSLDQNWRPVLMESCQAIQYYEPWRNVLRHITAPKQDFAAVKDQIFDSTSDMFDNLNQLEMLGRLLHNDSDEYKVTEAQVQEARASAEEYTRKFSDELELAYTYNRIDETEKENISELILQHKDEFFDARDFACWRQFLMALKQQVRELTAKRKRQLRSDLDVRKASLQDGSPSSILNKVELLLEEDSNFAVAEEYINRFDNGEREFTEELQSLLHDADSYSDFISEPVFNPIHTACVNGDGRALRSFGTVYLEQHIPKKWTTRLIEGSKKLLSNWPSGKGRTTPAQIKSLFDGLGFEATGAARMNSSKEELYTVSVSAAARDLADYRHPIAAFGTQMKSPFTVFVLYGNYTAKQLVDTVISINRGEITIVLIDRPIDLPTRRQIAEIFRNQTSGQNPFLLIDQVLFLHLALHQITERMPIMLKCTLPYTTYQPFGSDSGSTADEMFFGRVRELATIIDPNGACVVYGGRQLGKTALLERAESRCSRQGNKEYAVYCNVINCANEGEFVGKIIEDINDKTNLTFEAMDTIKDLCRHINSLFRDKTIASMLLLLDETDAFLGAISQIDYMPLQPLIDLKRETKNAFKFVLAGLHNVCRAKNATTRNGVFGQLGTPLCVKPLSPTDALQLLSRPLQYLGFQVDRCPHLETILTNTNYYPGILQFFGYTLVQTINSQYAKHYRAVDGNPPFTLQDEQLGAVMNSADLNRSIRDKFRLSLEMDARYFMLARCIAMLYHFGDFDTFGSRLGFEIGEIKEVADSYPIHCLANAGLNEYANLLDEMVEMGILGNPKKETYRLRRRSFINIIGADVDALDRDIIVNNEGAEI